MLNASEILNAGILIVDDQEVNVSLLEQLLSEAGYTRVASTMNAHEVCTLHRRNDYDLILLDLQMPGMDGFQVMAGLKANVTDGYLPVIVLTAQPGHKLRALQAGAKDFISKPFDLVEVKTRIHNMLEVRLLYRALAAHNTLLEQTDVRLLIVDDQDAGMEDLGGAEHHPAPLPRVAAGLRSANCSAMSSVSMNSLTLIGLVR